jgi:hypothetical protein
MPLAIPFRAAQMHYTAVFVKRTLLSRSFRRLMLL